MKKSIVALLFLLLLLIVTCVYQKTYTLYALTTTEKETTPKVEKKAESISPEKEQLVAEEQHSVETKKIVTTTIDKRSAKAPTLLEKIKTTVTSVISSENEKPQSNVVSKIEINQKVKSTTESIKQPTLDTAGKEKEVVDYLLTVLEERDTALANRDAAETRLQALIKQALENRRLAIENMDTASNQIEASHQKRLDERDTKAQNNTEEKGK